MSDMVKGRLVVFEGSDASGKMTQVNMLVSALREKGLDAKVLDFPTYDSPAGEMVSRYLRGELGPLNAIAPEIPSLLYALDRYQYRDEIARDLEAGKFLVANRYTQSNLAYQGAKFRSPKERRQFQKWVHDMESGLPRADLVIYLRTPQAISKTLIEGRPDKKYLKGKKKDLHEADDDYQMRVAEAYQELANQGKGWVTVECSENGKMRPPEAIHGEVFGILNKKKMLR